MSPAELLRFLVAGLDRLGLRYVIVGSTASITFGEPRLTNDIDVVVELPLAKVGQLCAAFPADDYYVSADAAFAAVNTRGQFNIIHPASGLKIDIIVPSDSEFDQRQLQRGVRVSIPPDLAVNFASPEDVILKKLEYYQEGGSEKHLRDIAGILRVRGDNLDRAYISEWATRLGVAVIWQSILVRLSEP